MGWAQRKDTDSLFLRKEILNHLNLDIIGIAETHLLSTQIIEIEGYSWFGNNRNNIHIRAKKGSGGVGFLVKNHIMEQFNIVIEDDTVEGILWLKFVSKIDEAVLHTCVCYLPPKESSRNIDADDFFDNLICQMHQYCKNDLFYICGNFNARCSDFQDFIEGVDYIQSRHIIDFTSYKYGELLCEFLINTNCCILNGRNMLSNDYTCIKGQGASVVDYCLIPHEDLNKFTEFNVHKTTDLINDINIIDTIEPETSKPDHSILTWKTNFEIICKPDRHLDDEPIEITKFSRDIPSDFLLDKREELTNFIETLENSTRNQSDADENYNLSVNLIKKEMYQKVDFKTIKIKTGTNNKKRRLKKPWWSVELTNIWNELCTKEKAMLKSDVQSKRAKRDEFLRYRKFFNKEVQKAKRKFWKQK